MRPDAFPRAAMKQTLQLKLSQHLTLTPQLQQSIRLLQLSTLELNAEVERMLQENPLLERDEGEEEARAPRQCRSPARRRADRSDRAPTRDDDRRRRATAAARRRATTRRRPLGRHRFRRTRRRRHRLGRRQRLATTTTTSTRSRSRPARCATTCMSQLALLNLPLRDRQIVAALIDALDDDGYLHAAARGDRRAVSRRARDRARGARRSRSSYLQSFEPAGVGARDCAECLALQLKALPADTPYRAEALKVVDEHLPLLAARDFTKLKRLLHSDDAGVRGVRDADHAASTRGPARRSPRPRRTTSSRTSSCARCAASGSAALNEAAMPKLRLNRIYADILTRNRDASNQQLAAQLQEAKWLIRNVQQRFETILRVAQAIVERQRRFFEHGEVAMRPMVLREIADMLTLHESTISRVTTQKYMLTPRGTFELKYFFGSHVATDTGGAASATAIRALIKQLVAAENAKTPLTDSQIADLLGEQGIVVARRTIAKYREALQIPPVNLRKAL